MLKKISVIFDLIILMVNLSLQGKHSGFERGFDEARKTLTEINFSAGTPYFFLEQQYFYIVLLSLAFLVGKSIKKEILSQIICIASLIWTIYIYWHIYLQKSIVLNHEGTFYDLTRNVVYFDWFCFSLVIILFIIQIVNAFQHYFDWKSNSAKIN